MNDRLLRALRCEPADRTPVWFMRQAGRCLPRYREIRTRLGIPEILGDPERAAEVTALPLEYFPVDAVILFMDLSTPFPPAGLRVEFVAGVGPVVDSPIADAAGARRLRAFEPREELAFVLETIRLLTERLELPVIGFVGAPFTLCSYLVPGGTRAHRLQALKTLMWRDPEAWGYLAGFWSEQVAEFAVAQFEAGAAVVQLFDSWAGELGPAEYERYVLPYNGRILSRIAEAGVPTIHFATGNPRLLPLIARAGGDAISVDWRTPIDEAWAAIGAGRAIQGNLDPVALLAGEETSVALTREILSRVDRRPGHIFNLGHGILPETDHRVIRAVVDAVHGFGGAEAVDGTGTPDGGR
ncbi:MAG: uroporphyrinogen decarboxylase [Gemmatimonadota bacterium]